VADRRPQIAVPLGGRGGIQLPTPSRLQRHVAELASAMKNIQSAHGGSDVQRQPSTNQLDLIDVLFFGA
jgi:hypothetical protein